MTNKRTLILAKLVVVLLSICPFLIKAENNPIEFFFLEKFQALKIKNTLKVIRVTRNDTFSANLTTCKEEFYDNLKDLKDYYLEDQKKENKISVTEYVFNDIKAADKAYGIANEYANLTRKLAKIDFRYRCYPLPEFQVYYASKDGAHVFLYTTYYNFIYRSREDSVDALMRSDHRILLDNLYQEIVKTH